MFNKKSGFGRLCLGDIISIFAPASSVVVAEGIDGAKNTLIQIYWRMQANNIL